MAVVHNQNMIFNHTVHVWDVSEKNLNGFGVLTTIDYSQFLGAGSLR